MLDAARVTHTGRADNDLGIVILQNGLGFLRRDCKPEPGECDGIDSLPDQVKSLLIIAFFFVLNKYFRGLHSQRAVHVDREIFVLRKHVVLLDMAQIIEHDLGPAHRKRGDHDISASGKSIPENIGKLLDRRSPVSLMQTVAVGGFHHNIVCRIRKSGILEQRLILIADVPGEDDLFFRASLGQPEFNAGGSQQMPDVGETEADSLAEGIDLPVFIWRDQADEVHSVFHRIDGLVGFLISDALLLLIPPLRLHRLDMCRIAEHNVAQTGRCLRGGNLAAETVLIEFRQHARMIDMGMCHDHEIDL